MNDTYGFVELWIAESIGVESLSYPIESGKIIAAIDNTSFNKVLNVINTLWEKLSDCDRRIRPTIVDSTVMGMRTLMHVYWSDDDILDEITGESAKAIEQYEAIKALGPSGVRFNIDDIKAKISEIINPQSSQDQQSTAQFAEDASNKNFGEAVSEEADVVVLTKEAASQSDQDTKEKVSKKKEEKPKISERQKRVNEFIDHICDKNVLDVKSRHIYKGYHVISLGRQIDGSMVDIINKITDALSKNIVIVDSKSSAEYVIKNMAKHYPLNQIEHHTLFLIYAAYGSDFVYDTHKHMLCFGHNVTELYCVKGDGTSNSEIVEIRKNNNLTEQEKDSKVEEIFAKRTNSPLYKYDEVFKDTSTNVIWALKDRCIIYLMVSLSKCDFYKTAFHEFVKRFNHAVSYDELKEIDKIYLDTMHNSNREEYIEFSISNSGIIIDELKKKRDEHKRLYTEYLEKALEHAKIFQKFNEQISYFDESKFMDDERTKAKDSYNETLAIDKVSSIVVSDNTVYVYTHNIYVQDERTNRWHDIGTFQISIGMHNNEYDTNRTVNIKNTKYQIDAYSTIMQAPHVWADGHICHGNLATGMVDAYKRRDMFALVYQVLLFLGEANTSDSAGEQVSKWPEVPEIVALGTQTTSDVVKYEKMHQLINAEKEFDKIFHDSIPVHT